MIPNDLEVARHVDRVRRRIQSGIPGVTVRNLAGGWVSLNPETAAETAPSINRNRMYWVSQDRPATREQVGAAVEALRAEGVPRVFFWIAPRAWDAGTGAALEEAGGRAWPNVQYPVLVRGGGEIGAAQPPALTARPMSADEARRLLSSPGPWYLPSGAAAALALVEAGIAEFHAAFDGDKPVTLGVLIMEGACGYLGFAATDPAQRRRGGQTALIRSRVRRALERGARWCVSETNTAVASSQGNLERCGFRVALFWRVYAWEDGGSRPG